MEPQLPYTIKRAAIVASSSGDNVLVAAVSGAKIRVLAMEISASGAVNGKLQSNTTDLTGLHYFAAAGDVWLLPYIPGGWCETVAGEKLDLNLSGAVAVGGSLIYAEV